MTRIYKRFAVASISVVAIIGSISPANAFQFFTNRDQWEATLGVPTETLDFGESRGFTGTTVFPNDVSALASVINGIGIAGGTAVGAVYSSGSGSVRGTVSLSLPSPVNALGFDASVGPVNRTLYANFLTEAGTLPLPGPGFASAFSGVISEPGDALITGFSISNISAGTGFFNASNISVPVRVSVPEASSTLGLLVAVGIFSAGSVFFRTQKLQSIQRSSET
ncbi:MAG: hypothetical protein ACHBN1_36010 [Heteroscytonema crispum UTEX LB 1556]